MTPFPKVTQYISGSCNISGKYRRNILRFKEKNKKKQQHIAIYSGKTEWEPKCRTFQINLHCSGSVEIYFLRLSLIPSTLRSLSVIQPCCCIFFFFSSLSTILSFLFIYFFIPSLLEVIQLTN